MVGNPRRFIRLPDVETRLSLKHTQIKAREDLGLIPKRLKLSERAVGWPEDEILLLQAAIAAGANDDQIRELVSRIHAGRAERFAALQLAAFGTAQAAA